MLLFALYLYIVMLAGMCQYFITELLIHLWVTLRAHKDEHVHMHNLMVVVFGGICLARILTATPAPSLAIAGWAMHYLGILIGLPLVVFRLDRNVPNGTMICGYIKLLSIGCSSAVTFALRLSMTTQVPIINSVLLTVFSMLVLAVIVPASKRVMGEESWAFVAPPALLAFEIGQAVLLLSVTLADAQFYIVTGFQLLYSIFKVSACCTRSHRAPSLTLRGSLETPPPSHHRCRIRERRWTCSKPSRRSCSAKPTTLRHSRRPAMNSPS